MMTTNTTNDTITRSQIERLLTSAGEHGDLVQVALCYLALGWTLSDMSEEGHGAARDALLEWDHPWANQIRNGTEDARALARVLCYQSLTGDQS